jgi:hydroxyquinol 1,2-dioxygenase
VSDELAKRVMSSFDGARSARYREVMQSLVRHLHAFIADVRLSEQEWATAVEFLTRTGKTCDDKRQEFILLSDVLGASMAVINVNHPTGGAREQSSPPTESTVLGPFFVEGAPEYACGDDISGGAPGEPCYLSGSIRGVDGEPVSGALIEVWQSDEDGRYDVQYANLTEMRGRGRLRADERGGYRFWSVRPQAYPIPDDGPVGDLLTAAGRGPMRPAHVHFKVSAPGYHTLITHVFAAGDEYLDSDAVFGVKRSLIVDFQRHEAGPAPDGTQVSTPFHTAGFDIVLARA